MEIVAFKNRIVGHGEVDPRELLANPWNFRVHTRKQGEVLDAVLEEIGWIQTVIVNTVTGHIVDGHLRVILAMRNEEPVVPATYVELSEEEERRAIALFDYIASMAAQDDDKYKELMEMVVEEGELLAGKLEGMLAELAAEVGVGINQQEEKDSDVEKSVGRGEELRAKWGVSLGQMWQLGEHKLICGDSRDSEVVRLVLGGDKAVVVFSDPPYGIEIGEKNRTLNKYQKSGRNLDDLEGDEAANDQDVRQLLVDAFQIVHDFVMADNCSLFVCTPQGGMMGTVMSTLAEVGLPVRHVIIWRKNQPTFSLGRLDYDYQHEPILFTWKKSHKSEHRGGFRTSVWDVDKPRASKDHPTMKPLELPENAILNHSDPGDVVFDNFLGSGTTLIACEKHGRSCRAIEKKPEYVAVALERFWLFSGVEPVCVMGEKEIA